MCISTNIPSMANIREWGNNALELVKVLGHAATECCKTIHPDPSADEDQTDRFGRRDITLLANGEDPKPKLTDAGTPTEPFEDDGVSISSDDGNQDGDREVRGVAITADMTR